MKIENVDIGIESNSGKAVSVEIEGEHHWVPLSVVRSMRRNNKVHGNDMIEIEDWYARKNGFSE